jgi:hypothetical protein
MGGRDAKLKNQPTKELADGAKIKTTGIEVKGKIVEAVEAAKKSASN